MGFGPRRFLGGGEVKIRKGTDPEGGCGPPATGARLPQSMNKPPRVERRATGKDYA